MTEDPTARGNEPDARHPWWILPSGRIRPFWWLAVAPVLIWVDYAAGPDAQLPAVYVLPVCVAAWYSGQRAALALATTVPLAHLVFVLTIWSPTANLGWTLGTTTFRATVVAIIALVFARQAQHERQLRHDLERRHTLQMQAEQLRVVQVTMRTVQDIFNNCLNQLLLLRLDAEEHVSAETLQLFDQAVKDAAAQLKALGELGAYAEKQMEIGTGIDLGEAGSMRR